MSHEIQILPSLLAADCIEGDALIAMHRWAPGRDPGDGFFTASLLVADCIENEENEDVIRAVFGDARIAVIQKNT